MPFAAVELTVRLRVDDAFPPAVSVTLAGLKVAVTPEGNCIQFRDTAPAKSFREVTVTVTVPLLPCLMITAFGLADKYKAVSSCIATM